MCGEWRSVGRVWERIWGEWESVWGKDVGDVGKCVEVWGPNTLNSPHLPTLTFPYISPYFPHTPSHFPTPPLIPLTTSPLPPPTPQHIFLLSPHLPSPSQVWRSYHVKKFLWRSYCTWRSYHVAKLLATY